MVFEESKRKWAYFCLESSDLEIQSGESDTTNIECLVVDANPDMPYFEVFDFAYDEFTRDELFNSLHDMINENSKIISII